MHANEATILAGQPLLPPTASVPAPPGLRPVPAASAYDALIAAVAIANDLPVHTCNPADFLVISDLEVVSVPLSDPA